MSPVEIAAYLGAAAWAPQIITWLYKAAVKPKVTVVPDRVVSIGYTTYGPIFNLNLAISSDRKDALIDRLEVVVRHSDGSEHVFLWSRLNDRGFEMSNLQGERIDMNRSQPAIALKVPREDVVEKFVWFQENRFHDLRRPLLVAADTHTQFLKSQGDYEPSQTLASKQFHDVIRLHEREFWWKPGEYTFFFRATSPARISVADAKYRFSLQQHEVDGLRENMEHIKRTYTNAVSSANPDYEPVAVDFAWYDAETRKL